MVPLIQSPLLSSLSFINHGFTTRQGGISTGHFESLNAAMEKEDPQENVIENRYRIAHTLGAKPENLLTLSQIHSNKVVIVDKPWKHEDRPQGDALITTVPGLLLSIVTADCVPVLLADPFSQTIAAVHVGWKGAASGIIKNTIQEMVTLGARRSDIQAAIGPCIWQEYYEVDQSFYESFFSSHPSVETYFEPSPHPDREGHWHFDLPGFVEGCLLKEEVNQLSPSPADTYSDEEQFFSYRRKTHRNEDVFGCSLSGIMIV